MAILTKNDAKNELKKAELEFATFLKSVFQNGNYIPFENFTSPEQEIKNFKEANHEDKFSLLQRHYNHYHDANVSKEERDSLSNANMSVLTSRFVFMGIPTEIIDEKSTQKNNSTVIEQPNYHKEAMPYITKLRAMKNIDKCEYKGKPLTNFLSLIQFDSNQRCNEKDFNVIKTSFENLERYNLAIDIISQIEGKVFKPIFEKEFAFKVAQSLKTSKGICSETQLKVLTEAKNKLVISEGTQLDMFSLLRGERIKSDFNHDDFSR